MNKKGGKGGGGGGQGGNPGNHGHPGGGGGSQAGEYGDLFELLRNDEGIPILTMVTPEGEEKWVVQPLSTDGGLADLNDEGEVIDEDEVIEVELGRTNIVRSPSHVLDHAMTEALGTLTNSDAVISLDFGGRLTASYEEEVNGVLQKVVKTIDSPRENLAIYKYLMTHAPIEMGAASNELNFLAEAPYNFTTLQLAAGCLAGGADKTGNMFIDKLQYLNRIIDAYGINPIVNTLELDFNGNSRKYYNFADYDASGSSFSYDREALFSNLWVGFHVMNGSYYEEITAENAFSLMEIFNGQGPIPASFTNPSPEGKDIVNAYGFATMVDDLIQAIELVHEDSNIEFLPEGQP